MTDEHGPDVPEQRKYLPTLAELIDRLSIVLLKSIFIPENRKAYLVERDLIEHDIDLAVKSTPMWIYAEEIRAILMLMLANHTIWMNESVARAGGKGQDALLKFTHSINGIRTTAKNKIAEAAGERVDLKADCLASDLPPEFGNWNVWDDA